MSAEQKNRNLIDFYMDFLLCVPGHPVVNIRLNDKADLVLTYQWIIEGEQYNFPTVINKSTINHANFDIAKSVIEEARNAFYDLERHKVVD